MIPRNIALILGITSCLLGGLIYILFRDDELILFSWINTIGASHIVEQIRFYTYGIVHNEFILYSLPDGLWLFSYILMIGYVWNMDMRKIGMFVLPMATFAIGCEGLQKTGCINGTYDWSDMVTYIISILLGFTILMILKNVEQ